MKRLSVLRSGGCVDATQRPLCCVSAPWTPAVTFSSSAPSPTSSGSKPSRHVEASGAGLHHGFAETYDAKKVFPLLNRSEEPITQASKLYCDLLEFFWGGGSIRSFSRRSFKVNGNCTEGVKPRCFRVSGPFTAVCPESPDNS